MKDEIETARLFILLPSYFILFFNLALDKHGIA
jgi:hypothetical protein